MLPKTPRHKPVIGNNIAPHGKREEQNGIRYLTSRGRPGEQNEKQNLKTFQTRSETLFANAASNAVRANLAPRLTPLDHQLSAGVAVRGVHGDIEHSPQETCYGCRHNSSSENNMATDNRRLENKVAVITGGASGMGLATVMRFLEEGARVVIADYNEATGTEAVTSANQAGFTDLVSFIRTDVAVESDIEAMLQLALDSYGKLDIVFNNAGVGGAIGPLTETSTSDWDYTFDVLAKGVFLGIKHAARIMQANKFAGSIINTASIAGLSGDGGPLVYSAAKAAVISMSKSAAVELARDRIRVNAICPGFIATPLAEVGRAEQTRISFAKSQPWPDYGRGEHIAGAALFLASDDAEFVTGESIVVDGGLTAAGPELSKKFPRSSGRDSRVSGITKGSTGADNEIRRLDE